MQDSAAQRNIQTLTKLVHVQCVHTAILDPRRDQADDRSEADSARQLHAEASAHPVDVLLIVDRDHAPGAAELRQEAESRQTHRRRAALASDAPPPVGRPHDRRHPDSADSTLPHHATEPRFPGARAPGARHRSGRSVSRGSTPTERYCCGLPIDGPQRGCVLLPLAATPPSRRAGLAQLLQPASV